jgi:hypothetical protein
MNWDDPAARGRLIESVGADEYNRLIQQHFKSTTVAVENGYPIRAVSTRFGRIFMVDGTNKGHATLEGAKAIARGDPPKATQG